MLTVLCMAWSVYCDRKRRKGETLKQQWLRWREAGETLLKVGQQFGLSPSARTRLRIEVPTAVEADPLERLLRDHGS
jgi:phage terminase small subunit